MIGWRLCLDIRTRLDILVYVIISDRLPNGPTEYFHSASKSSLRYVNRASSYGITNMADEVGMNTFVDL